MSKNKNREYIFSLMEKGDGRSYNEIAADLELAKWRARMGGEEYAPIIAGPIDKLEGEFKKKEQ